MVGYPHTNPKFKYVAADSALKCGGVAVVKDVVHALPDGAYQQEELVGGVVVDISMMTPRDRRSSRPCESSSTTRGGSRAGSPSKASQR